jgi:hypothetical protein
MPLLMIGLIFNVVSRAIRVCRDRKREPKTEPLCATCIYAHMQYGANAQLAISCGFGGAVRPMKLNVLYCTDYQARSLPRRPRTVGFVREIATNEVAS